MFGNRKAYGWLQLILGILTAALGIFTFFNSQHALTGVVIIYGVAALLMGILDIVFYVRTERYTGFAPVLSLISGIFSILTGLVLLIYPDAGKWAMVLLLPIWFIAHCVSRLTQLNVIRMVAGNFYYHFTLVMNILGIILGGMMILWPSISAFSIAFLIGSYLVLLGIDGIVMGTKKIRSKW